jgi:hypothetical protein
MTEIFTWKNCFADVQSSRYGEIARDFLTLVVSPSLDALDGEIQKWRDTGDTVSHLMVFDLSELVGKTRMAFCLSIQSLWEQQIRNYLSGCLKELNIDPFPVSQRRGANTVHSVLWGDELNAVFASLRGIALPSFESYQTLDLLQTVGNVCRHGDGTSSQRLWKAHPELWPLHGLSEWDDPTTPPSVQSMQIPRELLTTFVEAIELFWSDAEYIYNESIKSRSPSLEARLVQVRAERAVRFAR